MTAQEIIKALRCVSTANQTEKPDCKNCPYQRVEHGVFGEIVDCDIDRIGFDAADMLENMIELGVL